MHNNPPQRGEGNLTQMNLFRKKPRGERRSVDQQMCILCEKGKEEGEVHNFHTFDADENVRTIATELKYTKLPSTLAGGDLITIEAKSHLKCLVRLRNKYRSFKRKSRKILPNYRGENDRINCLYRTNKLCGKIS